jgi:hypothetical protein
MFFSCFAEGTYSSMVGNRFRPNHIELDVYRVALAFMRSIPPLSERAGEIRFWYHNRPPESLQSIQSTFLWGVSKVQGADPDRGLPYLAAEERERILAPGVRWLGMITEQEAELATGRAALLDHGVNFRPVSHHVIMAGDYTAYLDVLEILSTPPSSLTFGAPVINVTSTMPIEVNVYGNQMGKVTTTGGVVRFAPADAADHVAYPFVKVAPLTSTVWARVVVESPDAAPQSCRLLLQDQDFRSLASLGCSSATEYFRVPATTQTLRVNMNDSKLEAFTVPSKIVVALADTK